MGWVDSRSYHIRRSQVEEARWKVMMARHGSGPGAPFWNLFFLTMCSFVFLDHVLLFFFFWDWVLLFTLFDLFWIRCSFLPFFGPRAPLFFLFFWTTCSFVFLFFGLGATFLHCLVCFGPGAPFCLFFWSHAPFWHCLICFGLGAPF